MTDAEESIGRRLRAGLEEHRQAAEVLWRPARARPSRRRVRLSALRQDVLDAKAAVRLALERLAGRHRIAMHDIDRSVGCADDSSADLIYEIELELPRESKSKTRSEVAPAVVKRCGPGSAKSARILRNDARTITGTHGSPIRWVMVHEPDLRHPGSSEGDLDAAVALAIAHGWPKGEGTPARSVCLPSGFVTADCP